MSALELRMRAVGPWPMNTYVLVCPATRSSILFDPGADPETLHTLLADTQPIAIALTHTHADHIGALNEMLDDLHVPLLAHPGPHVNDLQLPTTRILHAGDHIHLGQHQLRVYATPGHTQDMLCFAIEHDQRVIVGDTIFAGGPGRTWSAADFQTTLATLRNVILAWPDATTCYPGHGPAFTIGEKRAQIEAFLARDHGDFYGDATWEQSA